MNLLKKIGRALIIVYCRPGQYFITAFFAFIFYLLVNFIHNLTFINFVFTNKDFVFLTKAKLILISLLSWQVNFVNTWQAIILIIISILLAINIVVLFWHIKNKIKTSKAVGLNTLAIISALLGVGCSACGSVLLTSFISLGFTAGILTYFPLAGQEFNILAIILLIISLYITSKKVIDPQYCKI